MLSSDEQLLCRPRVFVNLPPGDSTSQPIQFGMNIEASVIAVAGALSALPVTCGGDNGLTSHERDQRAGVDCNSGHVGLRLSPLPCRYDPMQGDCSETQVEMERKMGKSMRS